MMLVLEKLKSKYLPADDLNSAVCQLFIPKFLQHLDLSAVYYERSRHHIQLFVYPVFKHQQYIKWDINGCNYDKHSKGSQQPPDYHSPL